MNSYTDTLSCERGVATIEMSMVFMIIFVFIVFTYELLKFQNDVMMIAFNEDLAVARIDLAKLNDNPVQLATDFDQQIQSSGQWEYFNSLSYKPSQIQCFDNISQRTPGNCSEKSKLIKFTYQVEREKSAEEICELLGLPITLSREVITVNDYFK
ncbi:hypothetical protein HQN64_23855 [Enterobacteriaceae bacterium BIT-l23]|uniref:TadE/TadG family type IV pilus assembly protein n=1 Tax=Jejubacter sp. L23 TaxID=3092086 RepID=UPI0015855E1E|nr:hypothetical protein [Enterobacteriaceae bacterium BIT-l23]